MSFSEAAVHLLRGHPRTGLRDDSISNRGFISLIRHIQMLRSFMLEEKLSFSADDLEAMDLGRINNFRHSASGRVPTDVEWAKIYKVSSAVATHLGATDLKRKIRIRELTIFFGTIPLIFLSMSVLSTCAMLMMQPICGGKCVGSSVAWGSYWGPASIVLIFVWTLSQGGLGACAFLGTSVITRSAEDLAGTQKIPEGDLSAITISCAVSDITDRNFLKIRIVLGALFGFLFGLPIAHPALHTLGNSLYNVKPDISATDLALMITPFVIGFSTNLVLVLFSKLIAAIQGLFGVQTHS